MVATGERRDRDDKRLCTLTRLLTGAVFSNPRSDIVSLLVGGANERWIDGSKVEVVMVMEEGRRVVEGKNFMIGWGERGFSFAEDFIY